jgi:tRNA (guanine37-N1)-methyltransferase
MSQLLADRQQLPDRTVLTAEAVLHPVASGRSDEDRPAGAAGRRDPGTRPFAGEIAPGENNAFSVGRITITAVREGQVDAALGDVIAIHEHRPDLPVADEKRHAVGGDRRRVGVPPDDVAALPGNRIRLRASGGERESTVSPSEYDGAERGPQLPCARPPLQLDVFTLIPQAFAWLTEQRPVAAVLGDELDLRLFSYRDYTPLANSQVDDEPYGGGAGMVLRVDVVAAALEAAYGNAAAHRVVALSPQGRQLTQDVVEELAGEERLTLLSARFEGFDERVLTHLASDSISIGPYILSGGELPAMVLVDAIARRLPGALGSAESGLVESFSAELDGGLEYPHYTRPADFQGWRVPDVLLSGDHAKIDEWRRRQSRLRTAG